MMLVECHFICSNSLNFYTTFIKVEHTKVDDLILMEDGISLRVPFHHRILDSLVAFILRYALNYRLKVIRSNLKGAFNYSSNHDLNQDVKSYYLYLAKLIRQVLTYPTRQLLEKRNHMVKNPQLDQWLQEGKSVIVTTGHMGNWEWAGHLLSIRYPEQVCGLYKKIKSDWINKRMLRRRLAYASQVIEIKQVGDLIRLIKTKPMLVFLVADQNPPSAKGNVWTMFLRRPTAFVNGPESIASRFGLPVVYIHSAPRSDGGYNLTFPVLYDGVEKTGPGEITKRYASMLEKNIEEHRSHWLWSHRRWKRTKPAEVVIDDTL